MLLDGRRTLTRAQSNTKAHHKNNTVSTALETSVFREFLSFCCAVTDAGFFGCEPVRNCEQTAVSAALVSFHRPLIVNRGAAWEPTPHQDFSIALVVPAQLSDCSSRLQGDASVGVIRC